jgi:hypothetical protein
MSRAPGACARELPRRRQQPPPHAPWPADYGDEPWAWSIHSGSCGYEYQWPDQGTGWDVVALSDQVGGASCWWRRMSDAPAAAGWRADCAPGSRPHAPACPVQVPGWACHASGPGSRGLPPCRRVKPGSQTCTLLRPHAPSAPLTRAAAARGPCSSRATLAPAGAAMRWGAATSWTHPRVKAYKAAADLTTPTPQNLPLLRPTCLTPPPPQRHLPALCPDPTGQPAGRQRASTCVAWMPSVSAVQPCWRPHRTSATHASLAWPALPCRCNAIPPPSATGTASGSTGAQSATTALRA